MNITYWKKTDKNNNLLGILIKRDAIYTCCVEINETYISNFIMEEISYDTFVDIAKETNSLALPEGPIPHSLAL